MNINLGGPGLVSAARGGDSFALFGRGKRNRNRPTRSTAGAHRTGQTSSGPLYLKGHIISPHRPTWSLAPPIVDDFPVPKGSKQTAPSPPPAQSNDVLNDLLSLGAKPRAAPDRAQHAGDATGTREPYASLAPSAQFAGGASTAGSPTAPVRAAAEAIRYTLAQHYHNHQHPGMDSLLLQEALPLEGAADDSGGGAPLPSSSQYLSYSHIAEGGELGTGTGTGTSLYPLAPPAYTSSPTAMGSHVMHSSADLAPVPSTIRRVELVDRLVERLQTQDTSADLRLSPSALHCLASAARQPPLPTQGQNGGFAPFDTAGTGSSTSISRVPPRASASASAAGAGAGAAAAPNRHLLHGDRGHATYTVAHPPPPQRSQPSQPSQRQRGRHFVRNSANDCSDPFGAPPPSHPAPALPVRSSSGPLRSHSDGRRIGDGSVSPHRRAGTDRGQGRTRSTDRAQGRICRDTRPCGSPLLSHPNADDASSAVSPPRLSNLLMGSLSLHRLCHGAEACCGGAIIDNADLLQPYRLRRDRSIETVEKAGCSLRRVSPSPHRPKDDAPDVSSPGSPVVPASSIAGVPLSARRPHEYYNYVGLAESTSQWEGMLRSKATPQRATSRTASPAFTTRPCPAVTPTTAPRSASSSDRRQPTRRRRSESGGDAVRANGKLGTAQHTPKGQTVQFSSETITQMSPARIAVALHGVPAEDVAVVLSQLPRHQVRLLQSFLRTAVQSSAVEKHGTTRRQQPHTVTTNTSSSVPLPPSRCHDSHCLSKKSAGVSKQRGPTARAGLDSIAAVCAAELLEQANAVQHLRPSTHAPVPTPPPVLSEAVASKQGRAVVSSTVSLDSYDSAVQVLHSLDGWLRAGVGGTPLTEVADMRPIGAVLHNTSC